MANIGSENMKCPKLVSPLKKKENIPGSTASPPKDDSKLDNAEYCNKNKHKKKKYVCKTACLDQCGLDSVLISVAYILEHCDGHTVNRKLKYQYRNYRKKVPISPLVSYPAGARLPAGLPVFLHLSGRFMLAARQLLCSHGSHVSNIMQKQEKMQENAQERAKSACKKQKLALTASEASISAYLQNKINFIEPIVFDLYILVVPTSIFDFTT